MAALQCLERHIEYRQVVGHEEGVKPSAFQRLREALQVSEIEVRIRKRTRVAPSTGVDADGTHEGAKVQLSWFAHGLPIEVVLKNSAGPMLAEAKRYSLDPGPRRTPVIVTRYARHMQ